MDFINIFVIALIAGILLSAVWYIRRCKRKGLHCVGCPNSGTCSGCCGSDMEV